MFRTETNPLLMMTDAERSKTFLNGSKKYLLKKFKKNIKIEKKNNELEMEEISFNLIPQAKVD